MACNVCETNKLNGLETWKLREGNIEPDVEGKEISGISLVSCYKYKEDYCEFRL